MLNLVRMCQCTTKKTHVGRHDIGKTGKKRYNIVTVGFFFYTRYSFLRIILTLLAILLILPAIRVDEIGTVGQPRHRLETKTINTYGHL